MPLQRLVPEWGLQEGQRGTFFPQGHACIDLIQGDGFKLKEDSVRSNIKKKFFIIRLVRHWNRLSREVLCAPSLEVFKAWLDEILSNLV